MAANPVNMPPTENIVTLADVRAHLRYPPTNTADDVALTYFIYAADDVLRMECGDIVPSEYDELYDGGEPQIFLRHVPILAIQNVEEGWGWMNYELDYQQVNTVPAGSMYAYSLDSVLNGTITRRSAGNVVIPFVPGVKNIRVAYTAGRKFVPWIIRLAVLELIAHWWQNSQMRTSSNSGTFQQYDATNQDFTRATGVSTINQGVPYRILEMIKPYRRRPIIG